MKRQLWERWQSSYRAAIESKPAQDPTPVVDALGYAVWLVALGERQEIAAQLTSLQRLVPRAERSVADAVAAAKLDDSDDEALMMKWLHATMSAWSDALGGSSPVRQRSFFDEDLRAETPIVARLRSVAEPAAAYVGNGTLALGEHPPTATLVQLLSGRGDGLSAGRYGLHVLACDTCRREISLVRKVSEHSASGGQLQLAAAPAARVRAPSEGVVLAHKKKPDLEAVLFHDADIRRLAIYADVEESLRLVADGATTQDAMLGYWIGTLDPKATELDATLHLGDKTLVWRIKLPSK